MVDLSLQRCWWQLPLGAKELGDACSGGLHVAAVSHGGLSDLPDGRVGQLKADALALPLPLFHRSAFVGEFM